MLRRDYILRMMEEFSRAMSVALGLIKAGRSDDALKMIRENRKEYFPENDLTDAQLLPEEFAALLHEKYDFGFEKLQALAHSFDLEAQACGDSEQLYALLLYRKALALYKLCEQLDTTAFSLPRRQAIARIESLLLDK
ncbi:MAG: hypothetical protein Fur0041_16780 [Bacteroidia bacterium]